MKRNQAINAYTALLGVKLNKMSDEMTDVILTNSIALASVHDQLGRVRDELHKRTLGGFDNERLTDYDNLVTKMNALNGQHKSAIQAVINDNYADVIKARTMFVTAMDKWLNRDIDVDIQTMDRKNFVKAMKDSEQDITPATLEAMSVLFRDFGANVADVNMDEIEDILK